MGEVKRYDFPCREEMDFMVMPNGGFVKFDDYEKIRQQLEAERDSHKRMFNAAVMSLANIGELVGADENDTAPFNIPEILDDLKKAEFEREQFKSERDAFERVIREAREQKPLAYTSIEHTLFVLAESKRENSNYDVRCTVPLFSFPVPAMPIQDDKPSLAQQLEFVTAERDGIRKHRDQLLEKLGKAPHWVDIENPEDMPDDSAHVLWDGCDLSIDFTDTEVDYGTTFFSNGTQATHYLANLATPQSEVKPS